MNYCTKYMECDCNICEDEDESEPALLTRAKDYVENGYLDLAAVHKNLAGIAKTNVARFEVK